MGEKEQTLVRGSRTCISKAGLLGVALCEGPCRRWYLSLLQTPESHWGLLSKEPQMQELFFHLPLVPLRYFIIEDGNWNEEERKMKKREIKKQAILAHLAFPGMCVSSACLPHYAIICLCLTSSRHPLRGTERSLSWSPWSKWGPAHSTVSFLFSTYPKENHTVIYLLPFEAVSSMNTESVSRFLNP